MQIRLSYIVGIAVVVTVLAGLSLLFPATRQLIRTVVPGRWIVQLNGYR